MSQSQISNSCYFKTISARTLKFWILANLTKGSHHTDLFKNLRDDSNQFLEFWLCSLGMTHMLIFDLLLHLNYV